MRRQGRVAVGFPVEGGLVGACVYPDDVGSWTNATASTKGILRPVEVSDQAGLRNAEYPVSLALEPYVERYWTVRWDRRGLPAYRSQVLTHPSVNLSIEDGDGMRHGCRLPGTFLHGVVSTRFEVDLVGRGRVRAVKFRPGGYTALVDVAVPPDSVRRVGGVPWCAGPRGRPDEAVSRQDLVAVGPYADDADSADAAERGPDPVGVPGLDVDALQARVLAEDDDAAAVRLLDEALVPLAHDPATEYLDLLHVLAVMMHDSTVTRVGQAAAELGISVRSLQRIFGRYLGVGPKWVLRRYRLHDAMAAIDAGEGADLAALAAGLGWFDQAHFSRDFQDEVGMPPSQYRSRAVGRA